MALGAPYNKTFASGDTIEAFRLRIQKLYEFVDTIPVDNTKTHATIAVSSATTFPAISADSLNPISSASKEKLKAQIDRMVDTFIDGIQENNFIS